MTRPPSTPPGHHETTEMRSRLLRCSLAIDESRAYWAQITPGEPPSGAQEAFDQYWFGAKSLAWVKELFLNMETRFGAFPEALWVLHRWQAITPDTRVIICHWHLQLTDPLYRAFSGDFLIARRQAAVPEVYRNTVITWVADNGRSNWSLATRKQLATRLLSVALCAGLISGRRDPRSLIFPRIADQALEYCLYLLRNVTFSGSLLDNPYLRSVGLEGAVLEARLRKLSSLNFQRTGDLIAFDWRYPSLSAWAEAELVPVHPSLDNKIRRVSREAAKSAKMLSSLRSEKNRQD